MSGSCRGVAAPSVCASEARRHATADSAEESTTKGLENSKWSAVRSPSRSSRNLCRQYKISDIEMELEREFVSNRQSGRYINTGPVLLVLWTSIKGTHSTMPPERKKNG